MELLTFNNLINLFICSGLAAIIAYSGFYDKFIGVFVNGIFKRNLNVITNLFRCPLCLGFWIGFISYGIYWPFSFKLALGYAILVSMCSFIIYTTFDFLENK